MKYRGIKIIRVELITAVGFGREGFERNLIKKMYSPIGMNYPMTLQECKDCIDTLILKVMKNCEVSELDAINLIMEH
jgi:hypothetical protein